ncbi:glycosyltransferase family 4 protein [Novosphingobium sp.]|uniref:glycosyltransferase family 4 protein n=1 Tax=Novosphingobium sp. TaxID=1874826 RepID=UPI0038B9E9EB
MLARSVDRPFLFDASRLVWRVWTGRLPTGIDRVCLAYMDHFGSRSRAVLLRKGLRVVLSPARSDALYALLRRGGPTFRRELVRLLAGAALDRPQRGLAGLIYLNVGHTGLDAAGLPQWLARKRLRPVFLIHDLIPLTHPQFCREGEADRHRQRMAQALASAHGVIGNTQATLDELATFANALGMPVPPGLVAWLGTDLPVTQPRPAARTRPYFLMTGTIEARKNHALLLDVWQALLARLGDAAPDLVLVGQRGWRADAVFERLDGQGPLRDRVHELGRCDDATLLGLIEGARAVLMPSFTEGFGIPVIEALQQGVPVVASDLAVYREIAGDVPIFLDPHDVAGWTAALEMLLTDGPETMQRRAGATAWRGPTWNDHFARVEPWLVELGLAEPGLAELGLAELGLAQSVATPD